MGSKRDTWRLVKVDDNGFVSRSIRLRDRKFIGAVVVGVVLVGVAFVAIGRSWRSAQNAARIAELQEQVAAGDAQTQQLRQLAARLERAESNYRQLQRIMGGDLSRSERDVRLPSLPAGGGNDQTAAAAARSDRQALPAAWPVARRGFVSRSFEPEASGALGEHRGVDIAIPTGSYIRASGDGLVEEVGDDSVYGLFVRVAHERGFETLYAHNSALFVAEGDSVEQNEVLALSGNTGRSSAPHLHFEIRENGKAVDPAGYINNSN